MTQLARKVLKNMFFNSSGFIISGAGGLIFTAVLARLLKPDLFGIYHLVLSVALVVMTFSDLGINRTMSRYVSYAIGKDSRALARSYFRYTLKIKFLFAFLTSITLFILAKPIAVHLFNKPELALPLMIVAPLIFFLSLIDFLDLAFVGLQEFQYCTTKNVIYEMLRLSIIPLFILIGYSVYGALVGLTLAIIFTFFILLLILIKKHPYLLKGEKIEIEKRRVLRFLGYLTFSSLITGLFFSHIDVIMLGILMTTSEVGFYKAAFNIIIGFTGVISATTVLFPVFTQLEGDELRNAFEKVFRYLSMFAFPCSFGLVFLAKPLIKTMYGIEYLPAVIPFYVLCLLILILPMDFFGTLFTSKEKPEYPAKIAVIASGLNVLFNYFFILNFGMLGAAIATVTARFFSALSLGVLSKRVLEIFPRIGSIYKPLFSSLVMLAFLCFILPTPNTILDGISGIIISIAVYILTMFLIKGIDREDVIYLSAIVGKQERLRRMYDAMSSKLQRGGE